MENELLNELRRNMEVEKNKAETIELANNIYKVITDPEVQEKTTPEQRHTILCNKYKTFADLYPLVLAKMARENRYNEIAFRKLLDKIEHSTEKGMEKIIVHQADYAKLLYLEDCKKYRIHWSIKKANTIWTYEYQAMKNWVNKIKKQEDSLKNEYAEEHDKHTQEKKQELVEFIQYMRAQGIQADLSIITENSDICADNDEDNNDDNYTNTNEIVVNQRNM